MLNRDEAFALLQEKVHEPQQLSHAIETEAVLRALARRLGRDEDLWGVAGLLHDLDYASTKDDPARHGAEAAEMLAGKLPGEAVHAIHAHNEMTGCLPESEFDYALRCGETVTGLIHTNALVRPTGMAGMAPKSLKKKMKDKAFAASVNREIIKECEKIGLDLGEFFQISVDAITEVAAEVGLAK
jgi:putative nucleotidyltransferase with HDIG domain